MVISLKLADFGLWPSPEAVLAAPVDYVLAAWDFIMFKHDLERADYELNKDQK